MLRTSKSCTEFLPSLRSEDDEDGKVWDLSMKPRSRNTSFLSSGTNTSPDRGLGIQFANVRRLLTTLSLMDSLCSRERGPLPSSRLNTIIVRKAIFNWWTNTSRWLWRCSIRSFGASPWLPSLNGMTGIQATQLILDSVTTSKSAVQARLECIYADRTD